MVAQTFIQNDIYTIGYSGESNDVATETVSALVANATVAPSATFVGPVGSYSDAFDMTTNGNKALVQATANSGQDWGVQLSSGGVSGLLALSFRAALSGAPTSEIGLFTSDTATGGGTAGNSSHLIGVGTDRKLYFYTQAGALIATSTSMIPTAGNMLEVLVSYDALNPTTGTVWLKVYVDGVEELSLDTGQTWGSIASNGARYAYWGEYLGAAVNRGCTLYLDDYILRFSSTASEAPHRAVYPRIKMAGSVIPDGDGTYTEWSPVPVAARYTNVSTNDGNTTVINAASVNLRDTVKSSTANPMAAGSTVIKAQLRQVRAKTAAGKNGQGIMMYGTLGSEAAVSNYIAGTLGTTMVGRVCMFLWQDGDTGTVMPVFADAAANASAWGAKADASGTISENVTFCPGPEWIHYTATLPLGTGPGGSRRRGGVF